MFVMITGLVVLVMAVLLVVLIVHLVASTRNAVPPVFTPPLALEEVMEALDLPETGEIYDLGCGDGRVMEAVLRLRPQVKLVGVENNPVVWGMAKWRLGTRAKLVLGQIESVRLDRADRVFVYLGPGLMAELEPRFERELPKGARVVSQQFPMPNRKPDQVVKLEHGKAYAKTLYVYNY